MGHYSEYYEQEDERKREYQRAELTQLLSDLRQFRQYKNADRIRLADCAELYDHMIERIQSRLYTGG